MTAPQPTNPSSGPGTGTGTTGTGTGFQTAPAALRQAAVSYQDAASDWSNLAIELPSWNLQPASLGLLGLQANVVNDYNTALNNIITQTQTGATNLDQAATELTNSANAYDNTDQRTADALRAIRG